MFAKIVNLMLLHGAALLYLVEEGTGKINYGYNNELDERLTNGAHHLIRHGNGRQHIHDTDFRQDLNGNEWSVINSNKTIQISASVPGSIYTDLMAAGILSDPYYRFNDVAYRWVALDNWTYTRTFLVDHDILSKNAINLVFEGLDTVASVQLNGKLVGRSENMFTRYVFDVKSALQVGLNSLSVTFTSPVWYAADQAGAYPYEVPPQCPDEQQHGECYFNFIRKQAASFSWDWGPAFPTMGIWKNITLEAYDIITFRYLTTETLLNGNNWTLQGDAYFEMSPTYDHAIMNITISLREINISQSQIVTVHNMNANVHFKIDIPQSRISSWWPSGHGTQQLYDVVMTYSAKPAGHLRYPPFSACGEQRIRIGFRTVELTQEPIKGSTGLSFHFSINGKPIFMKGSNWIPADAFQERISDEYVRWLMSSAAEANMNMLRVWGGGNYESEALYDVADELGILLWQDMMFACAMYPSDVAFLENVKGEVKHQVRRLKHHPSIALWSGNNENEWGLAPYKSNRTVYPLYYRDYLRLYKDTIATVISVEDRSRPFVPSSPSDGVETYKEGWVATNPQDNQYGDIHHYDYSSDSWNFKNYPVPRFASEYGLQSWCSMATLSSVSLPKDMLQSSDFSKHRQHHPDGNAQLIQELSIHLNYTQKEESEDFATFIYYTQINQAMGMKTETELYRRSQSSIVKGLGHTMGALYWQLNDIWQAPTWASIEYGGTWKMLHYFAKQFFAPELISPFVDDGIFYVSYINESLPIWKKEKKMKDFRKNRENFVSMIDRNNIGSTFTAVSDLMLYITCFSWTSLVPLKTWQINYTKPQTAASVIYQTSLRTMLAEAGCPGPEYCLMSASVSPNAESSSWLILSNLTTAKGIQQAHITATNWSRIDSKTVQATLVTDAIAPFVWMEMKNTQGRFKDNGFLMITKYKIVVFTSWENIPEDFEDRFTVRALNT